MIIKSFKYNCTELNNLIGVIFEAYKLILSIKICDKKANCDKMFSMSMRKYTNDYEIVSTMDDKGREKRKAVYRGDYFEIEQDEERLLNFRRSSFFLVGLILFFQISMGFINNQGMNQIYVAFPYVFTFFPLMYLVAGIISLPKEKRNYRRDEVGLSFDRLKSSSKALLFLLGVGIIGEIIFLLFGLKGGQISLEIFYLALEMMSAGVVYLTIKYQNLITIKKVIEKD